MYDSIKKYKQLLKDRKHIDYWADNIIDSEALIQNTVEAQHFYQYVMNPQKYDADAPLGKTLGDLIDEGTLQNIKPYPKNMVEKEYDNGLETMIYVKNTANDIDDEKVPLVE